jgi:hypothetical protein
MADGRMVFGGLASLLGIAAALLLATTAMAQQGPPDRSTPVEANELRETWNDRVSQGSPADDEVRVRRTTSEPL